MQFGGSDQWGNITMGVDYVRRVCGDEVWGFTTPLIDEGGRDQVRQDRVGHRLVHWFRMAADKGNANAQLMLGAAYDHGNGVTKDRVEAVCVGIARLLSTGSHWRDFLLATYTLLAWAFQKTMCRQRLGIARLPNKVKQTHNLPLD